jgi:hypothetical protein
MPTIRRWFLQLTLLTALAVNATITAQAAVDAGLLALIPGDSTVLSGINVDQAKLSTYGLYMLNQIQIDDAGFQKFINDTGFDPRRDLSQIVTGTSGDSTSNKTVFIGRGSFNSGKIANVAQAEGGKIVNYKGVDMVTHAGTSMTAAIAFLDATTAVMGQLDSVKAVIDRRGATTPALPADVIARITTLASANDAWFLSTTSPATFFASKVSDQKVSPMLEAGMMQSVLAGSGGLKFSANGAAITAQAVARSDKDASALADVVRFFVNIVQSSRGTSAEAAQFATVLDSIQVTTQGSNMNVFLNIPEATLEQMFMGKHTVHAGVAGTQGRR